MSKNYGEKTLDMNSPKGQKHDSNWIIMLFWIILSLVAKSHNYKYKISSAVLYTETNTYKLFFLTVRFVLNAKDTLFRTLHL